MSEKEKFSNIFIEAISNLKTEDSLRHFQLFFATPEKLRSIFFDPETSSFVKGLLRTYDIDASFTQKVAFAILNTILGEQTLAKLSNTLSADLQLAPDQAQKMAAEIEKDIFGQIKGELDAFLSSKSPASQPAPTASTPSLRQGYGRQASSSPLVRGRERALPSNLLDLKEIAAAKRQKQLNAQPPQKQLPKRQVTTRIAPPLPRSPLPPPPHPNPLLSKERGTTALPKPAVTPIDFSKYQ